MPRGACNFEREACPAMRESRPFQRERCPKGKNPGKTPKPGVWPSGAIAGGQKETKEGGAAATQDGFPHYLFNPPCRKHCRGISAAWEVSVKFAYSSHNSIAPATTIRCRPQRVTPRRSGLRLWPPNHCECPTGLAER